MTKRVKAGTSKAKAAERRALFIQAYIANGGNATQAAITAGFAPNSADVTGARLLKDARVSKVIDQSRGKTIAAAEAITGVSVERTLRELGRIVHVDPRRFFKEDGSLKPITELDDDCAAALASVEVTEEFEGRGEDREMVGYLKKVKFWDKNAAIDKAMKHLGMFERDNLQRPPVGDVHITVVGVPSVSHRNTR